MPERRCPRTFQRKGIDGAEGCTRRACGSAGFCQTSATSYQCREAHLVEELGHDRISTLVCAVLLDTLRDQRLGILYHWAPVALTLVWTGRTLLPPGKGLDGGVPLDIVLGAEAAVGLLVAVDGVKGDQRGEGLGRGGELGSQVFAVAAPEEARSVVDAVVARSTVIAHQGATKATICVNGQRVHFMGNQGAVENAVCSASSV